MKKTIFAIVLAVLLMLVVSCATTEKGPVDLKPHSFTDIATIPNFNVDVNGKSDTVTAVEGCVVLDGYGYVAKIKNNKAGYLYRIDVNTGEKITMVNADTGSENNIDLFHANDLAAFEMDGKKYLLVGTLSEMTDRALLVLELVDTGDGRGFTQYRTAKKYGAVFNIMYDLSIYGIEVLSVEGHKVNLLVKSGMDFYTGSFDLDSTLSKIACKKAFTIRGADVQVDGKAVNVSMNDYYQQGYTLYNGKLYVPFTRIAKDLPHSIVFVYDYNGTDTTRLPIMSETLMFQHPDSTKFEIESFSFYNGKMYFSTNCDSPVTDGFHYFEF